MMSILRPGNATTQIEKASSRLSSSLQLSKQSALAASMCITPPLPTLESLHFIMCPRMSCSIYLHMAKHLPIYNDCR